jgi:hypothetical protein
MVPARAPEDRRGRASLLLRSSQPMAARHRREHERDAAPVFPKGTDLSMHNAGEIASVAAALNSRPRKTLDWKTPSEALDQLLLSANKDPCCNDRLNPLSTLRKATVTAWTSTACYARRVARRISGAMPRWRASIRHSGELVEQRDYLTRQEAQADIFQYVEGWYNRRRLHSAISMSPQRRPKSWELNRRNSVRQSG